MKTTRLLVIPFGSKRNLEKHIQVFAAARWSESLLLLEASEASPANPLCANEVLKFADDLHPAKVHIYVPKGMICDCSIFTQGGYVYTVLDATINQILRNGSRELKSFLESLELDCATYAHNQLTKWIHGESASPTNLSTSWVKPRIERWRRQFLRVDPINGASLATDLLRQVEVMPTSQMRTTVKQYGLPGPYGIVLDSLGKSWASVSVALAKSGEDAEEGRAEDKLLPLHEAIPLAVKKGQIVRVVEDGLYSATELLGVIESLMGIRKAGSTEHKSKSPSLGDPQDMFRAQQHWAYGCVTDYGQLMFLAMTRVWGLSNISLIIQKQTKRILLLSSTATLEMQIELAKLDSIVGFDEAASTARKTALLSFRKKLNARVNPAIGRALKIGLSVEAINSTTSLCQRIGSELWDSYLQRKFGSIDRNRWSEERVRECGLGKDGLGLSFAFAHSLPKATVPLFWASGFVTEQGGGKFDWEPLFPNAE